MDARYYATCLWPGLSEIWWRGRLSGLPQALAFTVALNLILVIRYLYPGWMAGGLVSMAWWIGIAAWIFFVVRSVRELPALIAPRSVSDQPDRFPEARNAYLRADWTEAGRILTGVLAIEPRDPPALLLLVGVYRHTGKLESAEILLSEIAKLEVADSWWLELAAESNRLSRAIEASKAKSEGAGQSEPSEESSADLTDSRSAA